jgi:hypothetical protein
MHDVLKLRGWGFGGWTTERWKFCSYSQAHGFCMQYPVASSSLCVTMSWKKTQRSKLGKLVQFAFHNRGDFVFPALRYTPLIKKEYWNFVVGYSKIVIRWLNLKGWPCSHDFIRIILFTTMCQCSSVMILGVKHTHSHVSVSRKWKVDSAIKNILFLKCTSWIKSCPDHGANMIGNHNLDSFV